MSRMPGVTWRPVTNMVKGGQDAVYGIVLHIMEGTLSGSDAWFRNSASQASAHFGVGKDGTIYQWVDTADRAWHAAAANRTWLGIEHEGRAGDSLTQAQIAADARILAWASKQHGFPLQATESPTGRGVGWHGMGGRAWGGHTGCPGKPIRDQRAAIITAARALLATPTGTYIIQKGDSLSKIAEEHGITLNALLAANPTYRAHPDDIPTGSRITIPPRPAAPVYVTVGAGDTAWKIARTSSTTLDALRKLNPQIADLGNVNPGDRIRVR